MIIRPSYNTKHQTCLIKVRVYNIRIWSISLYSICQPLHTTFNFIQDASVRGGAPASLTAEKQDPLPRAIPAKQEPLPAVTPAKTGINSFSTFLTQTKNAQQARDAWCDYFGIGCDSSSSSSSCSSSSGSSGSSSSSSTVSNQCQYCKLVIPWFS